MREVDLPVDPSLEDEAVIRWVEERARQADLLIRSRGSLRSYPGCVHWHFNKVGSNGTLEATWWPKKRRLWLKVAANREAAWMEQAVAVFTGSCKL
jgi:hypothetical protein